VPWPATGNLNDTLIVTSAGPPATGTRQNSGTGPAWAVVAGDYIYLYVQDNFALNATTGEPVTAYTVARSALADRGRPGTWWKFLDGGWASPGVGGNATALDGLVGAKVVWVETAAVWLAVGYSGALSVSADGLVWAPLPSTLLPPTPAGQPHPVTYPDANWYYYSSLIPGWGGTTLFPGDSLWHYYAFIPAGNGSWAEAPRGLASVELTLAPLPPGGVPRVVVSLCEYILHVNSTGDGSGSSGGGGGGGRRLGSAGGTPAAGAGAPPRAGGTVKDSWATVSPVDQTVYDYGWFIGYVFATPGDWPNAPLVGLVDCFFIETHDHFVARPGECESVNATGGRGLGPGGGAPVPAVYAGAPGVPLTAAYLGSLGWLLAGNATGVPGYDLISIWRCYDAAAQDHYLAPVYGCQPTDLYPTLLGYALWQNDATGARAAGGWRDRRWE
jgi:hypothetical protein